MPEHFTPGDFSATLEQQHGGMPRALIIHQEYIAMSEPSSGAGRVPLDAKAVERLRAEASALTEPMVEFARKLVRTPSLPGREQDAAQVMLTEMQALGFDEAWIDSTGNAVGLVRSNAPAAGGPPRRIMFNAHLDHVDVGDPARWPHPPYGADVEDGYIWGRATSDLKGSVAAQVYALALARRSGLPLPNDLYVSGVVQEEIGGHGSDMLAEQMALDYVIIGEPSENRLALGHRGRIEIHVQIRGRSVHASVPGNGVNPLYSLARFLTALSSVSFDPDPEHPALGPTTIAPTLISTDQTSANVTPAEVHLVLDVRNTPSDDPDMVLARVREVLSASVLPGATGEADIPITRMTSYTGVARDYRVPSGPFGISPNHPLVTQATDVLTLALGRPVDQIYWRFATDADHFAARGVHVLGFGPGAEDVIHTVNERIAIDAMVEAMVCYAALGISLG
jgi:putative selenium metabolism hydrolase